MTISLEPANVYREEGVLVLGHLLEDQTVSLLSSYAGLLGQTGQFAVEETQVPDSLILYGDAMFDTVMAFLVPTVSAHVGSPVVPTYSYVRLYNQGQDLPPHRDRRACQHSITLHLAASSADPWPLGLTDLKQRDCELELQSGDGVLYQGCAVRHWRTPCPVVWYLQAFFHFVESEGPFATEVFDRRPHLAHPSVPREATSA